MALPNWLPRNYDKALQNLFEDKYNNGIVAGYKDGYRAGVERMRDAAVSEMWAVWLRTKDVRDIEPRIKAIAEGLLAKQEKR